MAFAAPLAIPAAVSAGGSIGSAALLSSGGAALSTTALSSIATPTIFSTAASAGGGLLSGFSLLDTVQNVYQTIKPFSDIISSGTSVLQGISSYQQGQFMAESYELQTQQMRLQKEIDRVNNIRRMNARMRELAEINASALAFGFARGVDGLSGSVKLIRDKNTEAAIRDVAALQFNNQSSSTFEGAEAALLATASDSAVLGSKFDALTKIGTAVKLFSDTRTPS